MGAISLWGLCEPSIIIYTYSWEMWERHQLSCRERSLPTYPPGSQPFHQGNAGSGLAGSECPFQPVAWLEHSVKDVFPPQSILLPPRVPNVSAHRLWSRAPLSCSALPSKESELSPRLRKFSKSQVWVFRVSLEICSCPKWGFKGILCSVFPLFHIIVYAIWNRAGSYGAPGPLCPPFLVFRE